MQQFVCIGNLTRDPELSQAGSGIDLCRFGIAVNRGYTNADGKREVDFFNVVAWRGLAKNCAKYLRKGSKVGLSGTIQNREYTDKNGDKRSATEIVLEDIEFIMYGTGAGRGESEEPPKPTSRKKGQMSMDDLKPTDEDLPF